jgi:hypothetical protein
MTAAHWILAAMFYAVFILALGQFLGFNNFNDEEDNDE